MSDEETGRVVEILHELDAPPRKVWRALADPALRERWLPADAVSGVESTRVEPGREIVLGMRDRAPPFLESTVTFRVEPGIAGGTRLRIIHALTDARLAPPRPANGDVPLMRAA